MARRPWALGDRVVLLTFHGGRQEVMATKLSRCCLGLALAAISVAGCSPQVPISVTSRTTSGATSAASTSQCPQSAYGKPCFTAGPSPTPSSTPRIGVADVAFSHAAHGWAVGSACVDSTQTCTLLVDSTTDGGHSWGPPARIGQFSLISTGNAWPSGITIRFQGPNVWVSGPGIYESHDGGVTWAHTFTSPILALEPAGATAWAIGGCSTADPSASCVLFTSPFGSNTWSRAAVQPPFRGGSGGPTWAPVLERAPHGVAFLADGFPQTATLPLLLVTLDDGRSWSRRSFPCAIGVVSLRSPDGTTVWALCGGGGGAGNGPKAVYVSHNAGQSWQERANNLSAPPFGTISSEGYASSLAVTGDGVGLIGSSRGGIVRSTDGGHTWRDVGSASTCLLIGNGVGELWFLSSGDGWALEENDDGGPQCPLLVRTTDGGLTWSPGGSPLGWTANQG